MSHMLFRPLSPVPCRFQLVYPQLAPRQARSSKQAAAGSRSFPSQSWMLQQTCSCARSEAWGCSEKSWGAKCAPAKLTSLLTGTSCGVLVQAMGGASAALCKEQLHGSPQARLTSGGCRTFPLSPPIISSFWRRRQQGASSLEGWSIHSITLSVNFKLIITFCTTSSLTLVLNVICL